MSRFADPAAEHEVVLAGGCACPGTPHEHDSVWVQGDFSSRQVMDFERIVSEATEKPDDNATMAPVLAPYVRRWNLLDGRGAEVPVSAETIEMLRPSDLVAIVNGLAEAVRASDSVPNASGAPSAGSPLGSASQTQS